jgi:hypothetical protein
MSIILTIVGSWIGVLEISMEPIQNFFYKWPRNFAISLGVEVLIAQPIARKVMIILHQYLDKRNSTLATPSIQEEFSFISNDSLKNIVY